MSYQQEEVNSFNETLLEFIEEENKKIRKCLIFKEHEKLNKYYTQKDTALFCYYTLLSILRDFNFNLNKSLFIEPSAGAGVFLDLIEYPKIGFDIDPSDKSKKIIKAD